MIANYHTHRYHHAPATEQAAKNFVDRLGISPQKTIALRRIG